MVDSKMLSPNAVCPACKNPVLKAETKQHINAKEMKRNIKATEKLTELRWSTDVTALKKWVYQLDKEVRNMKEVGRDTG